MNTGHFRIPLMALPTLVTEVHENWALTAFAPLVATCAVDPRIRPIFLNCVKGAAIHAIHDLTPSQFLPAERDDRGDTAR